MKLSDYLHDEKIEDVDFASRIGRDRSTVSRLRRGLTLPDWETTALIAEATKGAVTANDFMPASPAPSKTEAA